MVVHRFRLYHSTAGSDALHNWLGQFTQNINAALGNEVTKEVPTLRETLDGQQYYGGDYAFEWAKGKAHFWGNVTVYARDYCDWYRMGYHECDHDETNVNGSSCSWEDSAENGPVPDYVGSF